MDEKIILLVEDNPDDELLTLMALKQNGIKNTTIVARDGAEALDYLFGQGAVMPQLVLLDLKLPKIDGLEVLQKIRSDSRTKLIPVVILDFVEGAVRSSQGLWQWRQQLHRKAGLYWMVLNESFVSAK